ncbi:MAG TPA: four helix bundle protein [Candidatus Nitrosopolaris sp.]|nr:four helix bundle protein [Candidatus Nitrosopolaris sp.]
MIFQNRRNLWRMSPAELKARTMQFAVRLLKFADALPNKPSGRTIANQVSSSGCSIASNYRAALRGKSRADFINKITTVLEEADETSFGIELTTLAGLLPARQLAKLLVEAEELTKIFKATRTTARNHRS